MTARQLAALVRAAGRCCGRAPRAARPDRAPARRARRPSADLRLLARRRAPRAVFDYTDGAAGEELSLRRSRQAYARVEFQPRVLQDVSVVDTSTTILGEPAALPLVFAPTGFTRMMHTEGEPAVARVAARVGIPYALSTMGTTSIERLAAAAPGGRRWFQLYLWRDREASRDFVARAREAGYEALVLTVDTPVPGAAAARRAQRPDHPAVAVAADLRRGRAAPGLVVRPADHRAAGVRVAQPLRGHRRRAGRADVRPGRDDAPTWPGCAPSGTGPLVVKGIQTVADARAVVDAGADAVVVSNHGGRQLDRAPTPLEVLPAVVDAVGDRAEVYVDGGILSGSDVVAAVALGARAALVGRAYLYGLMAGGERGVQRAADILARGGRRAPWRCWASRGSPTSAATMYGCATR